MMACKRLLSGSRQLVFSHISMAGNTPLIFLYNLVHIHGLGPQPIPNGARMLSDKILEH